MVTGRQIRMRHWAVRGSASIVIATVLAACQSAPTPDQMSRTTVETAPADLQLLCAGAAAKAGGVDSGKALPTSSRRLDSKSFQVELNVAGKPTSCIVDTDGKVASVQPA
ncbi:hypothetical protein [Mesorhizobium sp. NZP2298]|uniref:hypothetical protein n=1 Tax=Mesorhizobium sp. NZP2298 TaxID=2483403 RepID=UPI001FEFE8A1|nr:hypothetical protein [Mesorhizobium sp. NZP2298]